MFKRRRHFIRTEFSSTTIQKPRVRKFRNFPNNIGKGETEYSLPSGDVVDVLFKHNNEWIAAEVKSNISNTADIYRSMYQCIKYQAVLEAFQSENGFQPNCRVVLVLENRFPDELVELKNTMGINVINEVRQKD